MSTDHDPECLANGYGPGQRMDICICTGIRIGRASERAKKMDAADIAFLDAVAAREELAEVHERLRAQVEALPLQVVNMQAIPGKPDDFREAVLLADVLALLGREDT